MSSPSSPPVVPDVAVYQPTAFGLVALWQAGVERRTASTLNFAPGLTVANLAIAKVSGAPGDVPPA